MHSTRACLGGVLSLALLFACGARAESLTDAMQKGLVEVTVFGNGGSSGDTIRFSLRKTPKAGTEPLSLSVPAGLMLDSRNNSAQDMVVSRIKGRMVDSVSYESVSEIVLDSDKEESFLAEAYCAEFEKDNPSSNTQFSVTKADSALTCVLDRASENHLSVRATQAAIWIVTDHIKSDDLTLKFPVSPEEWTAAEEAASNCVTLPRSDIGDKAQSKEKGNVKENADDAPKTPDKPKPGRRAKGTGTITFSDPKLEAESRR